MKKVDAYEELTLLAINKLQLIGTVPSLKDIFVISNTLNP